MKKRRMGPPRIPKRFHPEPLDPEAEHLSLHALAAVVPWEDWIPRMLLFADWFIQRYYWHGQYVHASVRKAIAEDAVQNALTAFLEGRRTFTPGTVGLYQFLCWSLTSIIDAEARHKEHQQIHAALVGRGETRMAGTMYEDSIADTRIDFDRDLLAKAKVRILETEATGDQRLYITVLSDLGEPRAEEVARRLQWTVQRVRAVRRSIHRRFLDRLAGVTRPPRRRK